MEDSVRPSTEFLCVSKRPFGGNSSLESGFQEWVVNSFLEKAWDDEGAQ